MQRIRLTTLVLIVSTFSIVGAGCNTLPPGSIQSALAAPTSGDASRPAEQAWLLRGWRGLWSEGIDRLAVELRAAGIDARVYRADQARELGDALVARRQRPGPRPPLVLIGFSYGADDAVAIARRLDRAGIAVDLLVTIDPVTPAPVPGNVRVCRNYYQSNGVWDIFPWLRGVPLELTDKLISAGRLVNVNIRDRPDLLEPGTSHATIAANAKLHRAIVEDVIKAGVAGPH